jgi:hypothetical protein
LREPLAPLPGWEHAHDCGYVQRRNACIASAEALANQAAREAQAADRAAGRAPMVHLDLWQRVFVESMDALSKEAEAGARRRLKATPAVGTFGTGIKAASAGR